MIAPEVLHTTATFVARWEGFRPKPYLCPAGLASIGYGTRFHADGRAVTLGDPSITPDEGEAMLESALVVLADTLAPGFVRSPAAPQQAAMLSLAYNIGADAFLHSALLRKFNAGDVKGAADQFLVWDKVHRGGALVALPGLEARRMAEREWFLS